MDPVAVSLGHGWERCVSPEWLAGWSPRAFDLGDGTTEVVVMGEGPPLLLLQVRLTNLTLSTSRPESNPFF